MRTDPLGVPTQVTLGPARTHRAHAVERIDERWRIVDEWWRAQPIDRTYYRVLLDDGQSLTCFHAHHSGMWFRQRY